MKTTIIISILIFTFCINSFSQNFYPKEKSDSPKYEILVMSQKKVYTLGEPIIINVTYYNGSEKSWNFYRPDSSSYCYINYRNEYWRDDLWNMHKFNFERLIYNIPGLPEYVGYVPNMGGKINLDPGESYTFNCDIMEVHELVKFLPGRYLINFCDLYEQVFSDSLIIKVKFTKESIDLILDRILKENKRNSNIDWGKSILRELYPDFNKYYYSIDLNNIIYFSDEEKIQNEKIINSFKEFMNLNSNSDELKLKIKQLNYKFDRFIFMDKKKTQLINCDSI